MYILERIAGGAINLKKVEEIFFSNCELVDFIINEK